MFAAAPAARRTDQSLLNLPDWTGWAPPTGG